MNNWDFIEEEEDTTKWKTRKYTPRPKGGRTQGQRRIHSEILRTQAALTH